MAMLKGGQTPTQALDGRGNAANLDTLRRYMLPSGLGETQEAVLPGFPLKINGPNIYYLYVGPTE